jgi:hypothetical protein
VADIPTTTGSPAADTYAHPVYIGSLENVYDWFKGSIQEVAIYNVPLTAARIQAHYLRGCLGA